MLSNQFSLIFDEVYTQKQNLFSSKVIKWQETKQRFLAETYKKSIESLFTEMESEHTKFEKIIHELLKVTNAEYQILSKVKPVNEDKDHTKSKQSAIVLQQHSLPLQESQIFLTAIQKSHKKASLISELSEFSARFFAITSTTLNQMKSLHSQTQNRKQRYLFDYKKETTEEIRVTAQLCVKSETKYFCVQNFQKLREIFEKENRILVKTHEDARKYYRESLRKRMQILKDCVDNMTRFEELYTKVFCGKALQEIQNYFQKLIDDIQKQQDKFEKEEKEFEASKDSIRKQIESLHLANFGIFDYVMEQITLSQWHNVQLQMTKKASFTSFSSISFSSTHALRQQTSYQTSNVQFQIPQSNKITNIQQTYGYRMTITVDYKLLLRKESDQSRVVKEFLMNDLKIKTEKEKKVGDLRVLILKDRKTKEYIQLTFPDQDKREEFMLHWDRFEQLKKNTHGK